MADADGQTKLTEEQRSFLQRRVSYFGLAAASFYFFFILVRFGIHAADPQKPFFEHADLPWHFGGGLCFLAVWAVCRGGPLSQSVIHNVEALGLLCGAAATSMMAMRIDLSARPESIQLLALICGFVARAIYVPSTQWRTATLGVLVGVPVLVSTYVMYLDLDHAKWQTVYPELSGQTVPEFAAILTTWAAAWWVNAIVLCTSASKVIYGLRKEVHDVRQLGQYRLEEKLGEGGMGAVFRASHAMLRRPTAVKLLLPERAGEKALRRFEREVQLTASLTHANTITIFDYGRTPDGVFYYAMELIDGATLADVVALVGALPPGRVVYVLEQICGALAEAHGVGLVHRDIKPQNVMVRMVHRRGGVLESVKVLDFGLVKEVGASGTELTQADIVTGTPAFLSPEMISTPDDIDGRSDLYSLGALGYYLLTGKNVFEGRTAVEVCAMHLTQAPVPPSKATGVDVPAALEALILGCLAKAPSDRPADAIVLQLELQNLRGVTPWSSHDAKEWWDEYSDALALKRAERAESGSATVDIAYVRKGHSNS